MRTASPQLLTVREVARALGVPIHRATYAIETYDIEPTQRAGIIRLYDPQKLETIRFAVRRIAARGVSR